MSKLRTLLTGMAVGAGLMYFYDPEKGDRRRSMIGDQINQAVNDSKDGWAAAMEDLQNRSQGLAATVKSIGGSSGGSNTGGGRGTDTSLTPGIRLLLEAGGGILALYGLARKGFVGTTLGLTGVGIAARGFTNMDFKSMVGLGTPANGIMVNKAININAPVKELYDFWTHFDNFPKFMQHVKEVKDLGKGRTHWVVAGPVNTSFEWDAITTRMEPNKEIDWESTPNSEVKSRGAVQFRENPDGTTRVTVRMTYLPPAGAVGQAVATLMGSDPRQEMNNDLMRLKSLFETGKTTVKDQRVTTNDLPGQGTGQGGSGQGG